MTVMKVKLPCQEKAKWLGFVVFQRPYHRLPMYQHVLLSAQELGVLLTKINCNVATFSTLAQHFFCKKVLIPR